MFLPEWMCLIVVVTISNGHTRYRRHHPTGNRPPDGHTTPSGHTPHLGHTTHTKEKKMEYYVVGKFDDIGIAMCKKKCMTRGLCATYGFNIVTLSCLMLSLHLDMPEMRGQFTLMPKHLIQGSYGPCSNTTCGEDSNCVTDYGGADRCVGADKVCGVPPETYDTDVTFEGRYINARAHHTCKTDFRPCTDNTTRVCQPTGEWSNASTVCGQFRWHNATVPFDKAIPCGGGPKLLVHIHGIQPSEGGISMVLSSGDNQLLGVTCSYESHAKKVVINTVLNGTHGDPKSIDKYPLTLGKMFNMTLSFNNAEYMVLVDGQVLGRLVERLQDAQPQRMLIKNNIILTRVEMYQ